MSRQPELVAPPTFSFIITYRAMVGAIGDPKLNLDYSRVVHGQQAFKFARPLYAGDEVIVDSTIDDILTAGRNEMINMRQEVKNLAGELIVTTHNTTVSRGTAPESEG
jgi:acyl dehydratase